ncbi:MAG: hypothetical protein M3P87_08120 [Actinomycetota bacterium]|nr:hypothetical protein [Actinomycetota bacterium]
MQVENVKTAVTDQTKPQIGMGEADYRIDLISSYGFKGRCRDEMVSDDPFLAFGEERQI